VSRIETGEGLASARDIRDLAELYRADPTERDALVTAARAARPARTAWALRRQQQLHDGQDHAK